MTEHVPSTLDDLLDELAGRYARGDDLDLTGLIEQAGDDAGRFAELADRFLEAAPRREPSDAARAYVRELDDPPLLRLRRTRRLKVAAVATALAKALAVTDVARLKGYYQRLEGGLLDPGRVDERVWDALATILRAPVRGLVEPRSGPLDASAAYYRLPSIVSGPADDRLAAPAAPREVDPPPGERDDLDRLFLGSG